jgi:hypothetical protein
MTYPQTLPITNGWVRHFKPTGTVGDTWLYFEVLGKPTPDASPMVDSVPYFVYSHLPYKK